MHVLFLRGIAPLALCGFGAWLFSCGCSPGPARAAQASTCREQGRAVIATAATCQDAVDALERLVERSPECAAILGGGDGGAGVRCRDGGTHGDH